MAISIPIEFLKKKIEILMVLKAVKSDKNSKDSTHHPDVSNSLVYLKINFIPMNACM